MEDKPVSTVPSGPDNYTVREKLKILEARASAREAAAKTIGKTGVPWIVFLVVIGVVSSYFLPETAITAVIALVATATMALISMLAGITGTKETPEFNVIQNLIDRLDRHEPPFTVEIEGEKVVISHGNKRIVTTIPSGNKPSGEMK